MRSLIVWILLAFPTLLFAQDGPESCSPANPIVIDAVVDEWQGEWLLDSRGKFAYNICNDNENLYVRIKVGDDFVQRQMGLYGFTVFLNPKGKKHGKMGVRYPLPKDMDQLAAEAPKGEVTPAQFQELKKGLIKDAEVLELVGFAKEAIISPRLGLRNGILVYIRADDRGDFIYEGKFPFKAFGLDKASLKTLGVAFVTGRMIPKAVKPSGSGVPPGGGYPGIMPGHSQHYMNSVYGYGGGASSTPYSAWQTATTMSVLVTLK